MPSRGGGGRGGHGCGGSCCHMDELEARRRLSTAAWYGRTSDCQHLVKKQWKGGPLKPMGQPTMDALIDGLKGDAEKIERERFLYENPHVTAIKNGHEEAALYLLTVVEHVVESTDENGWDIVLLAARAGLPKVVRALADLGSDLGVRDEKGHTALCKAARSGSIETVSAVIDLFIISGRCPDELRACSRKSILMHAVQSDKPEMVEFLVKKVRGAADLQESCSWNPNFKIHHYAASEWKPNALRWLLQETGGELKVEDRADINCLQPSCRNCDDLYGMTVLHCAALDHSSERGDPVLETVKMLVEEFGADKEAKTKSGKTPAALAVREEVKEYLQKEKRQKDAEAAAAALLAELEAEEAQQQRKKAKKAKKKKSGKRSSSGSGKASSKKEEEETSLLAAGVAALRLGEEKGEKPAASAAAGDGDGSGTVEGKDTDDEEEEAEEEGPTTRSASPPAPSVEKERADALRPFTDEEEAFFLEGAPSHVICPLTRSLVYDPRIASDGFTYQRHAIEAYIRGCKKSGENLISPMTGEPLADQTIPNHLVKNTVLRYMEDKRQELRSLQAK